ncbi:MAG TPA: HAMP domain-containing sensor histidine kinase [Anaerolineaceae bacterium]|nr:HAMP domain-containing sensor histidine kinase [Anaerolineaceae bacterium]
MRNRLTMAFFGVICLTLGLVYLFIQNSSALVLQNSLRTAFQREIQPLIPQLTAYYDSHNQSWVGVDSLLIAADKTADQQEAHDSYQSDDLVLIDATGRVVAPENSPIHGKNLDPLVLETTLPVTSGGNTLGYLGSALLIGEIPRIISKEFNQLFSRSILIALLASGVIAMFYALLATNTVVQPITDMTDRVEEMARGNLHLRVDPEKYGYQNLVTLAESINFLTDSIDKAESQRREMVSDIAHELRNPLAVQKSYLEAMEDDVIPFSKDSLNTIQEQNLLLTRLVNDLRVLAAAESGELHLVLRQMDLTMALVNVLEQFSAKLDESGLTVNLIAPEPHPIILGDPNRIEQIINNLMQNETRYAPKESSLDIACYLRDHKAILSVRDYGVGVPESEREAIFVRLYRTDKGIRSESGGSGLGLPIARKLAEAHGGTLSASAPGKGVAFTLTLPLSYEPIKFPKKQGKPKK